MGPALPGDRLLCLRRARFTTAASVAFFELGSDQGVREARADNVDTALADGAAVVRLFLADQFGLFLQANRS